MKKNLILSVYLILSTLLSAQAYQKDIRVETLLKTDTTVLGQQIQYPTFGINEVTICKVTIPPGKATGWHKHLIPVFAIVQQGTLTVELENGETNCFPVHSTFAEVVNTYHNGTNMGEEDVVLIAFYLSNKGDALSIKKE
jgi:quercetin dioxygenase-like cupin family protein